MHLLMPGDNTIRMLALQKSATVRAPLGDDAFDAEVIIAS